MLYRAIVVFLLFSTACGDVEKTGDPRFADLRSYFSNEAARLEKLQTKVHKTVSRNEMAESKAGVKPNWNTELSMFTESDINKPAWRTSYREVRSKDTIRYIATESKLKTRSIEILINADSSYRQVTIINQVSNNLYSSSEKLVYNSQTGYSIEKRQHVILLGDNQYLIRGAFAQ